MSDTPSKRPIRRLSSHLFFHTVLVIAVISVPLIGVCGLSIYRYYERQTSSIHQDYEDRKMVALQSQIDEIINYIDYKKSGLEELFRDILRQRVYDAHAIATQLYKQYHQEKSVEEIQVMVREALRPIRFNNGRGYFFATRLDGVEMLFADRPELENKDLIDMVDTRGNYVIRDMIKIVKTQEEGFYRYTWTKPNRSGQGFRKLSFVKYFEPFDWLIGAGDYYEDIEEEIKAEVLARINEIHWYENHYIFVVGYDGEMYSYYDEALVGKNFFENSDNELADVGRRINDLAKSGGGRLRYQWKQPDSDDYCEKLTYVRAFPAWQWVIGTGVYVDEVESQTSHQQSILRSQLMWTLGLFLVVVFLAILYALWWCSKFSGKISSQLNSVLRIFERPSDVDVDCPELSIQEFQMLAESICRTLVSQQDAEAILSREISRLIMAQSIAEIGSWDWDWQKDEIILSPQMRHLCGFDHDLEYITPAQFEALIDKEDLSLYHKKLEELRNGIDHIKMDLTVTVWENMKRRLRLAGQLVEYEPGNEHLIVVAVDITHRRGETSPVGVSVKEVSTDDTPSSRMFDDSRCDDVSDDYQDGAKPKVLRIDKSSGKAENRVVPSAVGKRILVVEDNLSNQILLKVMLGRWGFVVDIAGDGLAALETVHSGRSYDIIFMDIQMPRMNGYETVKQLREDGVTTPIIALTANAMKGDREKCLNAGCDDYLTKPLEREELQEIIVQYIDCKLSHFL